MPRNTEAFTGLPDFRKRARKLEGSADYGAQLFCAWLRSLGVDARLVCSIQPLPFTFAASLRDVDGSIDAMDVAEDVPEPAPIPVDPAKPGECQPIVRIGQSRRRGPSRLGLGRLAPRVAVPRSITRPRHPIFWVEAFDPHLQRWIPVDSMANQTVARPTLFEPAMNDPENSMAYVFAFEQSGYAKDVTRRYAKAFTAKTRKARVERSDRGAKWLKKAMKMFKRIRPLVRLSRLYVERLIIQQDRDQVEDAALLQREISEGLPKNIEDFKGHPVYALQRHLLRNEAIYPLHEVGKVRQASRQGMAGKVEPVYRRRDVHVVKSADKWFRLGRHVKVRMLDAYCQRL
jgi:xeroderma pigmentosum group C-complementing protein